MLATRRLPASCVPAPPQSPDFLDRLMARDEDAFAELVRLHGPRLLAVASRYLSCRADAEDAVQEAFVNVVRFIGSFNRESALETWLHRIVVNCSLMMLRSRRRRPLLTNADLAVSGSMASPLRSGAVAAPGEGLENAEQRRLLHVSIRALPSVQRSAFRFRYGDGLRVRAIADVLGVSTSTVKTRLHRARHNLQASLTR